MHFIQKLKIILKSNTFLILLFLIVILNIAYKTHNIQSKYNKHEKNIIGIVTNINIKEDKIIINIKAKENIIVYYYNKINLELGDKVKVVGTLKNIENNTNFNLFNYKKYMLSKNTYFIMNAYSIKLISKNNNIFYSIKNKLSKLINKKKGFRYLNTFIMGDSKEIDENILESYRTNGISHLFSVSGMHITLLSTLILYILNKIKKSNINYILVIIFLIFYVFLTSFTPSVIRATTLFIFLTFNKLLRLNLSTLRIFLIILFLVLIFNPYNIYNIGFKFSYIISLYLIIFSKIINRNKNYITKTIVTSFIAFLSSIPILINNFFSINLLTIINNLIFVPIISFIIFPLSLLTLIIPKIDIIYEILINILERLSLFVSHFKIEIVLKHTNILIIILYYLLITFILIKILRKQYKYIYLLFLFLFIHTNINYITNTFFTTIIDVGQGDSTFIHLPHNKSNILIDTGGNINYDGSKNIISYLKSEGIQKLDYLIITHGDYDHMGNSINLVNNFKVKNVIFNCGYYNNLENKLIKILDKKSIKYYSCTKTLNIGKHIFKFLNTKVYDNENDNSSVMYFKHNKYKFLFMGDAGIEKEHDILEKYNLKDIDFLKIGHHGSNTSSSSEFINSINPKYSLISVGKNNRYGHPKEQVLNILNNSKIYRTDKNGSIRIKIKNDGYSIETCEP